MFEIRSFEVRTSMTEARADFVINVAPRRKLPFGVDVRLSKK
jgi:hypothetical protein